MVETYTDTARHFDVTALPPLLQRSLPAGPLAFADLGCGDGPLFRALAVDGFISPERPVYAVDLEPERLARVSARFPWIETVAASVDSIVEIGDGTLDFVTSTMVMEHVPDEHAYLGEIARMLRAGGRGYVTTVFKKSWAWYFRKREGVSVLDTSHLREYTDLAAFTALLTEGDRFRVLALERRQLWFPVLDPVLFRLARRGSPLTTGERRLRVLRGAKVPIPGYFSLEVLLER